MSRDRARSRRDGITEGGIRHSSEAGLRLGAVPGSLIHATKVVQRLEITLRSRPRIPPSRGGQVPRQTVAAEEIQVAKQPHGVDVVVGAW